MQFKSFHWLSQQGCMSHYTMLYKYGKRTRTLLGVFIFILCQSFLYFGGDFTRTIIPLALAGYEIKDSHLGATFQARISNPTRVVEYKNFQDAFIFLYVVYNCLYCDAVWCSFRQQVLVWNFQVFVSLFYCHGNFVELSLET